MGRDARATRLGRELRLQAFPWDEPRVRALCDRASESYGSSESDAALERASRWLGTLAGDVVVSVLGLQVQSSGAGVFVSGLYSDGSRHGVVGVYVLMDWLETQMKPGQIIQAFVKPGNDAQMRVMKRYGSNPIAMLYGRTF